jgi:hypothetical protein
LRKKFSQEQYDQDDAPAKKAVQKFLFKKWKSISINGEQYDVDLKCFRDGKIVTYVEVERRHNWKRDFEWQTIHVPERKRKFFVLDKPTYIFSVRSDSEEGLLDTRRQCPCVPHDHHGQQGMQAGRVL